MGHATTVNPLISVYLSSLLVQSFELKAFSEEAIPWQAC